MRIAIASQDLTRIDAHLGWTKNFMLYEVTAEGYRHLGTLAFQDGLHPDGDHDKLAPRLEALQGCAMVFLAAVGPEGELGLARQRITAVRDFAGEPIALALDALRDRLRANDSRWLRQEERRSR